MRIRATKSGFPDKFAKFFLRSDFNKVVVYVI